MTTQLTATEWRFAFDERAAILEYEGNIPRLPAENRAWAMTIETHGEPPHGLTLEACRR